VNPRLVTTAGANKGMVWTVSDSLTLGRDSSNQVEVRDPAVSRRHCAVTKVGRGLFEVADYDSHNGTFVNGTKVSRKVIQHGDRIRIGSSEYVFRTGADEDLMPAAVESREDTSGLKTISLSVLGPPADAPWVGRMARDLSAFFKIANVINSTHDVRTLQSQLLELISEVIPATQGAIVLQEGNALHVWHRKGLAENPLHIREDLVQQATWEQCAILSSSDTEHIVCVPLLAVERVLGVIYLSTSSTPFAEEHAFFLSSVARIAAVTIENVSRVESLQAENQRLLVEVKAEHTLIGESRPMQRVNDFVRRVARGDSTVLIRGESGTGKELVARSVHANGLRPEKPFVAINCAAIPEALLESELFGHEKGAFTGAATLRKGKFEAAEDGTLFLDEIGEMAPLLQAKLLRLLQQREFERLGGNRLLPFNARVVAATNKNLDQAIKAGEFRQDLYYRLNVVSILLPPLREHRDDIPALALYFANKYAARSKRRFKGIAADARSLLMRYSWPGNVRELENAIEHAIVMGLTDEILPEDLPNALLEEQSAELAGRYHNTLNQTKKQLVLTALDEAHGSPVEAARRLGIHPKYLHRLIRNLNLQGEAKRL
jgi:transcriptional regulator with GAF, ATPase, and Fis domain